MLPKGRSWMVTSLGNFGRGIFKLRPDLEIGATHHHPNFGFPTVQKRQRFRLSFLVLKLLVRATQEHTPSVLLLLVLCLHNYGSLGRGLEGGRNSYVLSSGLAGLDVTGHCLVCFKIFNVQSNGQTWAYIKGKVKGKVNCCSDYASRQWKHELNKVFLGNYSMIFNVFLQGFSLCSMGSGTRDY